MHRLIGKFRFAVKRANAIFADGVDGFAIFVRRHLAAGRHFDVGQSDENRQTVTGCDQIEGVMKSDQLLLRNGGELLAILTVQAGQLGGECSGRGLDGRRVLGELLFEFVGKAGDKLFRKNWVEPEMVVRRRRL